MSNIFSAHVRKNVRTGDPSMQLILMIFAECANDDGTGCWPSTATIADETGLKVRAVQYNLRKLQAAGYIREGDQRMVTHLRPDRRPRVYDVTIPRGAKSAPRPEQRGATNEPNGVQLDAPKPSLEPSLKTNPPISPPQPRQDIPPDRFDEFWELYPRRVAKPAAVNAYVRALKRAHPEVILGGVRRYAAENRDPRYIAHPATWLNQERWADELAKASPREVSGGWSF